MIRVIVSGGANRVVEELVSKALNDAGLKVISWVDCVKSDIPVCTREATRKNKTVAVMAMRDGR